MLANYFQTKYICRPCDRLCGHCSLVHYCSDAHYHAHRLQDRCAPFRVETQVGGARVQVMGEQVNILTL